MMRSVCFSDILFSLVFLSFILSSLSSSFFFLSSVFHSPSPNKTFVLLYFCSLHMVGPSVNVWSNCATFTTDEDPGFSFPSQPLPLPLEFSGFPALGFLPDYSTQYSGVDLVPLMESFPTPLDIIFANQAEIQNNFGYSYGMKLVCWNDQLIAAPYHEKPLLVSYDKDEQSSEEKSCKKNKSNRKCRDERLNSLTRNTLSQYFYMPITQAAKELNVGVTLLKKRCRDLGIRRWPHRKPRSLKTLIQNVQELEKEEIVHESEQGKLREVIQILEQERKLVEELPDLNLEDQTQRFRQAYFQINYKRKKLMNMIKSSQTTSNCNTDTVAVEVASRNFRTSDKDDELHSLLYPGVVPGLFI